ncbi:DUF4145 domain-containing protein [Agrobacterium pusense]|uniref:DUF4145 domain-containing protein n=1 Tax=Agrobacterium pusense TaxID=648995 RepID=A0AA44ES02_9HYPH|nr:DUF4145 domain-containing protein [Agrobacterium pusense]NRF12526.1 DUF4145 domain-containing protein [Agrobacterium pusense]NRF23237.1 DUF4145 domain-containing protein [Agrobacterium pusense]
MAELVVGSRWRCPFCSTNSLIGRDNLSRTVVPVNGKSKHGNKAIAVTSISCANDECSELALTVNFGDYKVTRTNNGYTNYIMNEWDVELTKNLLPDGVSVSVPASVPAEISITYIEAARIADISGRASAAMSRRCLQGMVRHFFDIPANKRGNLGAELAFVKDRIDPEMWDNLLAVSGVGDIGAHMDNNVDQIIDISPEEARILLALIESLFKEWYEAREKRERSSAALKEILVSKRAQQKEAKQKSAAVADEQTKEK